MEIQKRRREFENSILLNFFKVMGIFITKTLNFFESSSKDFNGCPEDMRNSSKILESSLLYRLMIRIESCCKDIGILKFTMIIVLTALLLFMIFQ